MRKTINALIRNGRLAGDDPVKEYLQYLTGQALAEVKAAPAKVSHSATRLAEAARVSGVKLSDINAEPAPAPAQLVRPIPGHIKRPTWRQS